MINKKNVNISNKERVPKVALISGITGQDGSYFEEFLLKKNYKVHGIKRRSSSFNSQRIDPAYFRPTEVDLLIGDASKANNLLGWKPKTDLEKMFDIMIKADLQEARKEKTDAK